MAALDPATAVVLYQLLDPDPELNVPRRVAAVVVRSNGVHVAEVPDERALLAVAARIEQDLEQRGEPGQGRVAVMGHAKVREARLHVDARGGEGRGEPSAAG
jgi:hypothetical protein